MNPYSALWLDVQSRINWREYFISTGVSIDGEQDDKGFADGRHAEAPGNRIEVNLLTGKWRMPQAKKSGNIFDYVQWLRKIPDGERAPVEALGELATFCGLQESFKALLRAEEREERPADEPQEQPSDYFIPEESIRDNHDRLMGTIQSRYFEVKTGISDATAKRYMLGLTTKTYDREHGPAWYVPIYDRDGLCRTARMVDEAFAGRWDRNALSMIPKSERGPRLYGLDEMLNENWKTVVIVLSEFERLMLMQERKRRDWGAVAVLDRQFVDAWLPHFHGRAVAICPQADKHSSAFSDRVLAPRFYSDKERGLLPSVKVARLPLSGLDGEKTVLHWFRTGGSWEAFERYVGQTDEFVPVNKPAPEMKPLELKTFSEIDDPKYSDKRVRVPICISGDSDIVYDSPAVFKVGFCQEIEAGTCNLCKDRTFEIQAGCAEHIGMYGSNDAYRDSICREICCKFRKRPRLEILGKYTFREVFASPHVERLVDRGEKEETKRRSDATERRIYVRIPEGKPEAIEPRGYYATGWVRTNPKNAHRTLLVEELEPIQEGYETFRYQDHLAALTKLREIGWKGICDDLAEHVTRIRDRDEIILLILLTYCSPLHLDFNAERIRGWLTTALIGDTGVGKSKSFELVSAFAGIGDIFQCMTGRRTGLTFAISKTETHWRCRSGMLPRNSRKLLCIEEAQKMDFSDLQTMADAMDKGFIAVEAIARGNYESKTRLIINCNPKDERRLSSYTNGCMAAGDLFAQMFIRRLDIAAFLRKDNDASKFNKAADSEAKPKISSEELRALIFYAWSLTSDRVRFTKEATDLILSEASRLSEIFGHADDIPLVCPSDFRKTLARICAAWAVLALHTPNDFKAIEVIPQHVRHASALISSLYASPDCALDRHSAQCKRASTLEDFEEIKREILTRLERENGAADSERPVMRLLVLLSRGARCRRTELRATMKCGESLLTGTLSFMAAHHLTKMDREDRIGPTPKFGQFFKRLLDERPEIEGLLNLIKDEGNGKEG